MKREDLGHEPEETHDRDFAPVNEGSDARGRTVRRPPPTTNQPTSSARPTVRQPPPTTNQSTSSARPVTDGEETSGTGTPGVEIEHPDTLPPDEEGVEEAESHDDSRRR